MTKHYTDDVTPAPLMQFVTSYWLYNTFATAVLRFDLFSKIAKNPGRTFKQLAGDLCLEPRPARVFLAAVASLGLLDLHEGKYYNTRLADAFLVKGRRYYFGGFIGFLDARYERWHDIGTALRENRPLTFDPSKQDSVFSADDEVMMELFWEAMHSISSFTARALATTYDFGPYRRVLDVGGGSGAFPIELCLAHNHLEGLVYDLPHACEIASRKIMDAGLSKRIGTESGNFLKDDELPGGYDAIVLSSILHDWDEENDRKLLLKCYEALPKGGTVLISEIVMDDDFTGPPAAALMGMHMVLETPGGQNYTGAEYAAWLKEAGFQNIERFPFEAAGANGVIVGSK